MSPGGFPYDITGHFQDERCLLVYPLDCKTRASTTLTVHSNFITYRIGLEADHCFLQISYMLAFATVGSTKFDALVRAVLSEPVLTALRLQGYTTLVVQSGNSVVDVGVSTLKAEDMTKAQKDGVDLEIWKFKSSLETEYDRADLVISHAGACHRYTAMNHVYIAWNEQVREQYSRC
jgi:Glycosyltransferase family 28 C-terminal domain